MNLHSIIAVAILVDFTPMLAICWKTRQQPANLSTDASDSVHTETLPMPSRRSQVISK